VKTLPRSARLQPNIVYSILILAAVFAAGCAGPGGTTITPPPIVVSVTPPMPSVQTGKTQQFTATVTGTANTAVTWQISSPSAGAASIGTISATGLYTAPANVPTGGTVTVTATSQADTTKTGNATVTVTAPPPVGVAISPKTPSVQVSKTLQFTATVTNTTNTAVTWQVNGVTGGGAATGTISAGGLYTAPAAVPTTTIKVAAISQADAAKSDSTNVTVTSAPVISITLSPTTANVQAGIGAQNFSAVLTNDTGNKGVTWSLGGTGCSGAACGTLSNVTTTSVTYSGPASVPSPALVTLTATSIADPTKSSPAGITVTAPVGVTVAPTTASVNVSKTQSFTATVTNDAQSKGVTWSLSGTGCSGATCGSLSTTSSASGVAITYTAPAAVPAPATVAIKATSVADGTRSFSSTITVVPAIGVSVAPSTPNVTVGLTQTFTATVTNDLQNKGVTWALSGTGCSGVTCGTLSTNSSASGVAITYMAPAAVPSPATVTLTAKSVTDTSRTGTATITVVPAVVSGLSVSISPVRGGLTIGQSMNFTATVTNDVGAAGVTWSATSGTISNPTTTGATFSAPGVAGTVTVTATSVADITKSASATLGVTDLAGVTTYHNNLSRDGSNTREFALTPSNVTTASFGKRFACTVDAAVYGQPLWVPNLMINGAKHNVIFAVTQHDSIYAFDADASPCVTLWSKVGTTTGSLIPTGETWVTSGSGAVDVPCGDLQPAIGIVGTPVIDLSTNTIYLVTKTKTITPVAFHQRLHALDITNGAEKFGGPTEISASLRSATFTPLKNNQRPGLALVNGNVYIGWSSHCDQGAYQGWMMAYSASTLAQVAVFTPAPNAPTSIESGIWMSGGAPAADSSNNLYLITGNGTFDANNASAPNDDYGDSFLKLSTASGISVADYFTPSNESTLQTSDADFGSGGAAILVDQPSGPVQHLVIGGGKDGILFLLNRDNMGKFTSTNSGAVQSLNVGTDSIYATAAFWNNKLFIGGAFGGGHVQAFDFVTSTGKFNSPSSSQSPTSYGFPGATPSVSANGTSQGIVWAIDSSQSGTSGSSVLHAYDASNLANELWNSGQVAADRAGFSVKFTVPTVANGKVYIGTGGEISVYGLKP